MKTTLFSIALLIAMLSSAHGQEIEGLGKLKLGQPFSTILPSLVEEIGAPSVYSVSSSGYEKVRETFAEIKIDSGAPSYYYSLYNSHVCPDSRVYFMNSYKVAGIALSRVFLVVYRDTLVAIHCEYSSDLEDALKLKFGEPSRRSTKEMSDKCYLEEKTFYSSWSNSKLGVTATSVIGSYYDSDCEKQFISGFSMSMSSRITQIGDCDRAIEKRAREEQDAAKRKKLDDL